MTPDIALAASARDWTDRLHRHVLAHGGAKVVGRVMSPDQALGTSFDVMLIDDVCSFLTPGFVDRVKRSGAEIVGVYTPADASDAKRRLLECGISDVIEDGATPAEFLATIETALEHRMPSKVATTETQKGGWALGVVGATAGVGTTEIAIALAQQLSQRVQTVLVDADLEWPSVAQRLDLPVHPNIRTAIDAIVHRSGGIDEAIQAVGSLGVVGGRADWRSPSPISHPELAMLFEALDSPGAAVIVDLGAVDHAPGHLIRGFDTVAVVGHGSPVGLARLIVTIERLESRFGNLPLVAIVNQCPAKTFHQAEIRRELEHSLSGLPLILVQTDQRVAPAAWSGEVSGRGALTKAAKRVADLVAERVDR